MYFPGQKIITIQSSNTFSIEGSAAGGMGLVLFARREKDGNLYALKTLRRWNEKKDELVKDALLFQRESLVWITLGKHKNVVQAFWFEWDDRYRPFIIMEYIQGGFTGVNLRNLLTSKKKLELTSAISFTLETINGLIYAKNTVNRELKIPFVHKDISPENLLITKEGTLKVTDFGLVMGKGGKYPYMPPEQWRGEVVEEKTDVYSIGCVLYEMLSGHRPFLGHSEETLKRQHQTKNPESLKDICTDVNNIVLQCLRKAPQNRPGFLELQDKLQRIYKKDQACYFTLKEEVDPLSAKDLNARGSGFSQLGAFEKALECYTCAIELDPNNERYFLNRGNVHLSLNGLEGAEKDFNKALAIVPDSVKILLSLGNLFAGKGENEKALQCYHDGMNLSPEDPLIYLNLGNTLGRQGNFDQAEKHYEVAKSIRSGFAEAYLGLGNVYLCQGNYEKSEHSYLKALQLHPLYVECYLNLARLYHITGQYSKRDEIIETIAIVKPLRGDIREIIGEH
jgi:serine/threonine protein kinase